MLVTLNIILNNNYYYLLFIILHSVVLMIFCKLKIPIYLRLFRLILPIYLTNRYLLFLRGQLKFTKLKVS